MVSRSRLLALVAIARAAESSKPGSGLRLLHMMTAVGAPIEPSHKALGNVLMQRQLALLPGDYLHLLARVVRGEPRLGCPWISAATEWERRRRDGLHDAGPFPKHGLAADDLFAAISILSDFAARISASPHGAGLARIVAVLDAAVESLTAEMEHSREPSQ